MAERQELESGGNRGLIVGNLPTNCLQEFLVNFFESRRQFGDGIMVENVDIQNDEAIVTFHKATDVDQVLQRHHTNPCVLGHRQLSLKPLKTYGDALDGGSFVTSENNNSVDSRFDSLQGLFLLFGSPEECTKIIECYSKRDFKRYDSTSSICSIGSVTSVDSSELFGSGREKFSFCSEEFQELQLIYHPPSRQAEQCKVKLWETDILPVLVSYTATTCPTASPTSTKRSQKPVQSQSLLQEMFKKTFGGAIDVKTVKPKIVLTLAENVETVNNIEDFQKAVLANIKLFEKTVTVQLLELNVERYDLAINHFIPLLHNNPAIKMYSSEDEFSLYIAFQSQSDKELVDTHTVIVKNQNVIKQEKPLSLTDYFKIQAYRRKVESQKALVTIEEKRVIIHGFQEDILSAATEINKVLQGSHCSTKRLEEFAVKLLQNADVVADIKNTFADVGLKVWWKVSDHFMNIVGKNEKQTTGAIDLVEKYFYTCKINMPDYLLDSSHWENVKVLAVVNSQNRLVIDDKTERPVVNIKGRNTECKNFADVAHEFKTRNVRLTERKKLTEVKCDFIFKYLLQEIESQGEGEYLKLSQESDKTVLIAEGTVTAQAKLESKLKEISTQKFWISDESAANRLKKLSEDNDCQWNGTVHVFKNQTKLSFKTGRIEEEQVDVIVNSAAQDLNLETGDHTITRSIRAKAGEQAQACLQRVQIPVPVRSVVVGDAGNMACKAIFHAVLERFNSKDKTTSIENVKSVITSCLDKATKKGYASIAFPALCTGVHEYPVDVVAEIMLESITAYCIPHELQALKEIVIVFLEVDQNKRKIFEDIRCQRQKDLESLKTKKTLWNKLSWPCQYYCHITAASPRSATQLSQHVNAELMEQTFAKRLEQTE